MRTPGIILISLALLGGLTACTSEDPAPKSAPQDSIQMVSPPITTPSAGTTVAPRPVNPLVSLRYQSGQASSSFIFQVPNEGFSLSYTCKTDAAASSTDTYAVLTNAAQKTVLRQKLKCDNVVHRRNIAAINVQPTAAAKTVLTVAIPGDKMGVDSISLDIYANTTTD